MQGLGFMPASTAVATGPKLRQLEALRAEIREKNQQFFYRWRPLNAEYVVGRRVEPFGSISFPPEMRQLDEIVTDLDNRIWKRAKAIGMTRFPPPAAPAGARGKTRTGGEASRHQTGQMTMRMRSAGVVIGVWLLVGVSSIARSLAPSCRGGSLRGRSDPAGTESRRRRRHGFDRRQGRARTAEARGRLRDLPLRLGEGVPGDRQPARDDVRHARTALGAHLAHLPALAAGRAAARQAGDPGGCQSGRTRRQADGVRRRPLHPDRFRAG